MSAIETLEDAFHLLRELPLRAWLLYLAGAVPFLIAFIYFEMETTTPGFASSRVAAHSLVCALLFCWLSACKAQFSVHLLSTLRASPPRQGMWWRAGLAQAGVQSFKLFLLPMAFLVFLPYAWAVAFFRNVTTLASQEESGMGSLIRRAARSAGREQRENWTVLAIFALFSTVVFLNVVLLLIILPTLFRIFSGYETEFTRGTGNPLNASVLVTAVGLCWLALDPVLQAVYARRCFQEESRRTGADLLATLSRVAAAVLFFAILAAPATAATEARRVPATAFDDGVKQVLQQPQYAWQQAPEGQNEAPGFFGRLAQDTVRMLRQIRDWVATGIEWIRRLFLQSDDSGGQEAKDKPLGKPLRWSLYFLLAAILLGIAFFLVRMLRKEKDPLAAVSPPLANIDLADPNLTAADLPEDQWLALYRDLTAKGDLRHALRALYLAQIAHLGERSLLTIARAKSNRDYIRELRRRARAEAIEQPFERSAAAFEASWYGRHEVTTPTLEDCERDFHSLKALANA